MRRTLRSVVWLLALSATSLAWAQPAPEVPVPKLPKPVLPKAAPKIAPGASARAAASAAAAPAGSAPVAPADAPQGDAPRGDAPAAELPAGHPQVAPGTSANALPSDSSSSDPTLPKGEVVVEVVNPDGTPRPGTEVRLGVLRQSVAEGESREFKSARANESGVATFTGLDTNSAFSYRAIVQHESAEYAAPPFNLSETAGQRVKLHVYPVASDINEAFVGSRGIVVVQLKDDVFQFEVLFRVFNMGKVTWVPENLTFSLPEGAKGFVAQESMSDTRVQMADDRTAQVVGTFTPGQHDLNFRFQVPNDYDESVNFELGLLPHVAEVRVMADAAKGMNLAVAGFNPAETTQGMEGQRVLVTARQLRPGEPEMTSVSISLSGVPVPGPGRWVAVGLAAAAALFGLWTTLTAKGAREGGEAGDDLKRARQRLLDELVELERAHRSGDIGPKTYESAKKSLLNALARVEAQARPRRAATA
ncbi:MAG: hypothetical protein R3B13_18910 [Polyangiaceae bacterium]